MQYQHRLVSTGSEPLLKRKKSIFRPLLFGVLWALLVSPDAIAWNQIYTYGTCTQTGSRCRATITNSGGNLACCAPESASVSVCVNQNPCRGIFGYRWTKTPVEWELNLNGMAGKSAFSKLNASTLVSTFQRAWDAWSKVPCTSLEHKYLGTTSTKPDRYDKKVVLYLPNEKEWTQLGMDKSVLAFAAPTPNDKGELQDGDILFNPKPGAPWGAYPNVGRGDIDLTQTATHEVGHSLGLGHTQIGNAVMYYSIVSQGAQFTGLSTDDKNAICTIYPRENQCLTSKDCAPCRACAGGSKCLPSNPLSIKTCKVCDKDSDCGGNSKCVTGPAGKRCLQKCSSNCCPTDFQCSKIGADSLCTPKSSRCPKVPCTQDANCIGGSCFQGFCKAPNNPFAPNQCSRKCSADQDCAPSHKCVERITGSKFCAPICDNSFLCPQNLYCLPKGKLGNLCMPANPFFCPCENDADCPQTQTCKNNLCQSKNGEVLFAPCSDRAPCQKGLLCIATSSGKRCVQPCNPGKCSVRTTCQPINASTNICIGTPTRDIGQSCDNLETRCKPGLSCVRLRAGALSGYCVESCSLSQGCKSGGACNQSNTKFRYCECGPNSSCGTGRTCKNIGTAPNILRLCVCESGNCPDLCNNRVCDADKGENCGNCPDDCRCPSGEQCLANVCTKGSGTCGNQTCEPSENCSSCPKDCACPAGQKCNQNQCQPASCGNGTCDPSQGENCSTCRQDCACPSGETCNNGTCQSNNASCGNGTCENPSETCANCAADCACPAGQRCQSGVCQKSNNCGNSTCDSDENCDTCPSDCACGNGRTCKDGVCKSDGTVDVCGNNVCDFNVGENCSTCESDCRCPKNFFCQAGICRQALCPPEQQKQVCNSKGVCNTECELQGCSCNQGQSSSATTGLFLLLFALFQLVYRRRRRYP